MDIAQLADRLTAETAKIIYGKETQIRLIVMALLSQGHVLLEDLPGVGKTTLIKTLAAVSGCRSKRIQFVPDLLPADILGMNIYDRNRGEFRRLPGPVFTNLLLADEINRAVPRTQSALLEAMEERQVTIDGETLPLPTPFVVMATQNPVESESTFRLPPPRWTAFSSASPWATPPLRRSGGCSSPWETASRWTVWRLSPPRRSWWPPRTPSPRSGCPRR